MTTQQKFNLLIASLPPWAQEAYLQSTLVHRFIHDMAHSDNPVEDLPWLLAKRLYDESSFLQRAALEKHRNQSSC